MADTVKAVAARVGLPARTVRYYDRIGLVSPGTRSGSGYRLYGAEEEGRLRFVRQAKGLGLSLGEVRTLMAAAERGCCGEVVPELDRLLDQKIAELDGQLVELAAFRDRLLAFRTRGGPSCGCDGHSAFCGCLNETPTTTVGTEKRSVMSEHSNAPVACECGCATRPAGQGCGCGCDGSCGCGTSASADSVEEQVAQLEQARRRIDERLIELQQA